MQVHWSHGFGVGDENGIAWVGGGSGGNGDAINGGGYVSVRTPGGVTPPEENGASAQPHGTQVDAHTWVVTA